MPSNNVVFEPEIERMLAGRASARYETIPATSMAPEAYDEMLSHLGEALARLGAEGATVIGYACLSTSLVQPPGWDDRFTAEVERSTGLPAVTAARSLVDALKAIGARSVVLLTPYPPHIDSLVAPYLARFGITVVDQVTLDIPDIHNVGNVTTEQLLALARSATTAGADAVAILATDLPTLDAVDAIGQLTGLPVVTANGAVLAAVQQRAADRLNLQSLEP